MKMVNAVVLSACTGMLQKLIFLFSIVGIVARNDHKPGCKFLNSMRRETILPAAGAKDTASSMGIPLGLLVEPKQGVLVSMQVYAPETLGLEGLVAAPS